jgi:tetratricopeptide (TPR) repeat protein
VNPARFFRQSAEFGTLEVGKRADLVLLTANPLADISNIHKISGVVVHGCWLDHPELSRMLEGVQPAYQREVALVEHNFETDPTRADKYLFEHDPLNRLSGAVLSDLAANRGIVELQRLLASVRKIDPTSQLISEASLNALGYSLLEKKRFADAILIFGMNTDTYPTSTNTWDSLAEAYSRSGDMPRAVENYRHALSIDPKYVNSDAAGKFIADHTPKP